MQGELISIQDAAELVQKSSQTIRRLVKSKKVKSRRKKTPQGFVYLVNRTSLLTHMEEKNDELINQKNEAAEEGAEVHEKFPEPLLGRVTEHEDGEDDMIQQENEEELIYFRDHLPPEELVEAEEYEERRQAMRDDTKRESGAYETLQGDDGGNYEERRQAISEGLQRDRERRIMQEELLREKAQQMIHDEIEQEEAPSHAVAEDDGGIFRLNKKENKPYVDEPLKYAFIDKESDESKHEAKTKPKNKENGIEQLIQKQFEEKNRLMGRLNRQKERIEALERQAGQFAEYVKRKPKKWWQFWK